MGIFEDSANAALGDDSALNDLENAAHVDTENSAEVLESLVGEGKKFKSVEALARGKVLSDAFIEKLISEKRQLEKELQERKKIEDFMTEIKNLTPNRDERSNDTNRVAETNSGENAALDPQALTEQILKAIEDKNRATVAQQNAGKVVNTLKSQYGNAWLKTLEEFTATTGMTKDLIDEWAVSNPDAVIQAVQKFRPTSQTPVVNPPQGRFVPLVSSTTNGSGLNKYSDFAKVRKTDPEKYHSREFQVLMHDTAVKMGDAFFT